MIVNIAGLAGAGKDTVAEALAYIFEKDGTPYKIRRYAQPLKEAAEHLFGPGFDERNVKEIPAPILAAELNEVVETTFQAIGVESPQMAWSFTHFGYAGKTIEVSPRRFQQVLGTEIVRAVKDSAWVDALVRRDVRDVAMLVPDCRFPNEAAVGHYNVYVHNPHAAAVNAHVSEDMAQDLFKQVAYGVGTPFIEHKGVRFDVLYNPGRDNFYFGNQLRALSRRIVEAL